MITSSNWLQEYNFKEWRVKTLDGGTYHVKKGDRLLISTDSIWIEDEGGVMIFPAIQVIRIDGIK